MLEVVSLLVFGEVSSSRNFGKWPSSGRSKGTHTVILTGMMVCAGLCALRSNLRDDRIMCRRSKPRFASYPSERLDLRRKMSVDSPECTPGELVRFPSSSGTKLVLYTLSSSSASSSLPKFNVSSPSSCVGSGGNRRCSGISVRGLAEVES